MRLTGVLASALILSLVIGGAVAGCSGKKARDERQRPSELTERQRDSTIAASRLPGASAVGRAMAVSDSAEARAKRMDEGQ